MIPKSPESRIAMGRMEEKDHTDHAFDLSEENKRKIVRYWSQVNFLKQIGMSGHKARRISYQRAFENDCAASQNIITEE